MDIPVELLDKNGAKDYFRKFGRVIRMCIRPKSRTCSIEYDTPASAQRALEEAGEYNGNRFIVGWDMQKPNEKKQSKKKINNPERNDPDWKMDPDVEAELKAMAQDYPKQYNLRPTSKRFFFVV